ncbi:MAG: PEGA domain-containing protein [Myxococcales bacterium]|nr:PEGA domain-containing protein [Myxococcales bacterium]
MSRWLGLTLLSCCSVLVLVLAPSSAHAEDKAKAVRLLGKGDKLLAKGDRYMEQDNPVKGMGAYEEALGLYKQAYEHFNSPKIFFPIARAEHRLGRHMEAMEHYQAMLRGSDDPKPELVAEVHKAIAEVHKELVALDLIVEQAGAVVSIDGKDIGRTPLDGLHYMTPGEHKYMVTLDGHSPEEGVLDLTPGKVESRRIRLDALKVIGGDKLIVAVVKSVKKSGSRGTASKKPLTIGFGVSGAMLIGAGFSGIAAKARHDRYEDVTRSDEERRSARDSGKTYRLVTDVFLAGGVLAAGYGTYYYYAKYKTSKEKTETMSSVRITPYASGDGAGVALGASF